MAGTVRLQLEALGYAGAGAFAGPAGDADLAAWRPVVPWLEDTKVRHLPIAARAALRDTAAPGWEEAALGGYLRDLQCPFAAGSLEAFRWLLSYAVMLEYQDNAVGFNSALAAAAAAGPAGGPGGPGAKRDEPAGPAGAEAEKPYADAGSAETAGAVEQLAAALGVAFDARDLSGTLERVIAGARSRGMGRRAGEAEASLDLGRVELGFEMDDPTLVTCAKVLRSLYIQDLRGLQTQIDRLIVEGQEFTANPKTDAKLGKVGR